jgi:hypothetical protein
MRCLKCGYDNSRDAIYCSRCGYKPEISSFEKILFAVAAIGFVSEVIAGLLIIGAYATVV